MAGLVLGPIVTRALAAAHERVERREDVERDQHRAALEELAVIHLPSGRQRVLQLPGQPDGRVVVRPPGPARPRAAGHRLPETGHALREAVKGRAEADVVDEGQGLAPIAHAQRRRAAEPLVAPALERERVDRHRAPRS